MNNQIKKLEKIAESYKKKYNLDTFIDIAEAGNYCCFKDKQNTIEYSLEYVKTIGEHIKSRFNFNNIQELYVVALLHELYHAIDKKNNSDLCKKELFELDNHRYQNDLEYQRSRPFELRADDFARVELEKIRGEI